MKLAKQIIEAYKLSIKFNPRKQVEAINDIADISDELGALILNTKKAMKKEGDWDADIMKSMDLLSDAHRRMDSLATDMQFESEGGSGAPGSTKNERVDFDPDFKDDVDNIIDSAKEAGASKDAKDAKKSLEFVIGWAFEAGKKVGLDAKKIQALIKSLDK